MPDRSQEFDEGADNVVDITGKLEQRRLHQHLHDEAAVLHNMNGPRAMGRIQAWRESAKKYESITGKPATHPVTGACSTCGNPF